MIDSVIPEKAEEGMEKIGTLKRFKPEILAGLAASLVILVICYLMVGARISMLNAWFFVGSVLAGCSAALISVMLNRGGSYEYIYKKI